MPRRTIVSKLRPGVRSISVLRRQLKVNEVPRCSNENEQDSMSYSANVISCKFRCQGSFRSRNTSSYPRINLLLTVGHHTDPARFDRLNAVAIVNVL